MVWHPIVACALASLVACSGSDSDVRQTGFAADSGATATLTTFDQKAEWVCGNADLQAVFAPAFVGDALTATIEKTIADPRKADATFSFVAPIDSFYTEVDDRALCMTLAGDSSSAEATALVAQLRSSGNVASVRRR